MTKLKTLLSLIVVTLLLSSCSLFKPSLKYAGDRADWRFFDEELSTQLDALVFSPHDGSLTTLVFYPGGKVKPDAYADLAEEIVRQAGVQVIITPMPLDLAILNGDAAEKVRAQLPAVQSWLIGGHSLGGVMAAQQTFDPELNWRGLVLLASYPLGKHDLSDSSVPVLTVIGSNDTVVDAETWQESLTLLPGSAQIVTLRGGNHAGFGTYGDQAQDSPADISVAVQQQQTAAAISRWLTDNALIAGN